MVDAVDDLIGVLWVILTQRDYGEPAKPDIFLQQFLLGQCTAVFEVQIFAERQGIDGDRHIAACQIGGDLAGHELGVGAGHIDVGIRTFQQAVDRLLPAGDFLNLVQQEVTMSLARHGSGQLVIHLLGGDVLGNIHLRVPLADDLVLPNTAPQQFLSQHLKDRRLAAATDTGKYLDERLVDKRLDCRDIVRSVDHRIASLQLIVYPK